MAVSKIPPQLSTVTLRPLLEGKDLHLVIPSVHAMRVIYVMLSGQRDIISKGLGTQLSSGGHEEGVCVA